MLLAVFSGLALILAAAGIHGVMSHLVALRTAEIGVRMTLGATPSNVMSLVLREGTIQAVVGLGHSRETAFDGSVVEHLVCGLTLSWPACSPHAFSSHRAPTSRSWVNRRAQSYARRSGEPAAGNA